MKKNLEKSGMPYEEIDIGTNTGRHRAASWFVTSLPTLIVFGPSGASSLVGMRSVHELTGLMGSSRGGAEKAEKSSNK
jgi:hypothetical protein